MIRVLAIALVIAGCALAASGAVLDPAGLARAWLLAWAIAIGPGIGAVLLALIGVLAPGPWYERLRARTRPLLLALPPASLGVIGVFAGMDILFGWTDPHGHAAEVVTARGIWHEAWFFMTRQLVWLGVLSGVALLLAHEKVTDRAAAGGLAILAVIAATGLALDISMSIDPVFHSTIWGLYVMAGQAAAALGVVLALTVLADPGRDPLHGRPSWLLFGACALWGYHAFMQYLVIWSGDLPHFAAWYLDRNQGAWLILFLAVCALFAAPAAFLLQPVRHSPIGAAIIPALVVCGFALETIWRIAPGLDMGVAGWLALAGFALGGLGLAGFTRGARRAEEAAHG
ncbi:hypothetical protein E5163_05745 [Marinicauda algicola]|uniref:Quinol:cytochrome C oxidoreductase n=1 Tax=Marinicauda algicola TaxID=2029849 RepID=A0A4V3RYJ9_9PROT|nr:hypothetical protein [Marinicauda algicola]TGY90619.1 hypothetical protein E5163_05745 [Marinicauda algicola]